MIVNDCFKIRGFILVAALITGLGFVAHAKARDRSFLVELNSLVNLPEGVILINGTEINNRSQVLAYATYAPEPGFITRDKKGGI